jgi:hypothetical protein
MHNSSRIKVILGIAVTLWLTACSKSAPPASQFQIPALGTLMPGGHEEAVRPELSVGQSGALIINQTGFSVQVAVSNTIATVGIGQDFLFALPPGTYDFYIYEHDSVPRVHTERLEDGKLRYLYITRIAPPSGG